MLPVNNTSLHMKSICTQALPLGHHLHTGSRCQAVPTSHLVLSRAYSCASSYRAAKQCLKVSTIVHSEARNKVLRWCAIWDRTGALIGEAGSLHSSALCRDTALDLITCLHSLLSQSWPYTQQSSAELFSGVFGGCICTVPTAVFVK